MALTEEASQVVRFSRLSWGAYGKAANYQSGPRPIKRPNGPSPSLFGYKYQLQSRFEVMLIC
ncbi:hypothetical protein HanXRQr2_Chr06g0271361 [Helianthus annuus]|uniref:Uncharacterized protein n=1 Tax=Helianthus annuus TaxID=4232 RepID=A0A9K3IUP0_HELAN|nr:hypothetical protein HanXRQr2_Chr06g0271361 [Helianthus annuus]KAJ0916453.1 hypothetical protein HanPSC8_Chr06g0261871 [Helianthus annuus]